MILSNDTFRYYNGSAGLITLFGWTMIVCGFLIYLVKRVSLQLWDQALMVYMN